MTMSNLNTNKLQPQYFPLGTATGGTESDVTWQGTSWRECRFTTSGTLTVSKTTLASVLIIGGGGAGGSNGGGYFGGGGGAGGVYFNEQQLLTIGTYTVTVAASVSAAAGQDSTFNGITCGGGGLGANALTYSALGGAGRAGAGGGYAGATGGGGSSPGYGQNIGPGGNDTRIWGVYYGVSGGGSGTANRGYGGSMNGDTTGGSGLVVIRYRIS